MGGVPMICSRCSLGAALLVERNKIMNDPNQVVAMRYGPIAGNLIIHQVMETLARELHYRCGDKCDCQHKENVVVGIDWSKVNSERMRALAIFEETARVTENGINKDDQKAAGEI